MTESEKSPTAVGGVAKGKQHLVSFGSPIKCKTYEEARSKKEELLKVAVADGTEISKVKIKRKNKGDLFEVVTYKKIHHRKEAGKNAANQAAQ